MDDGCGGQQNGNAGHDGRERAFACQIEALVFRIGSAISAIALNILKNRLPFRLASLPSENGERAARPRITVVNPGVQEHSLSSRKATRY
jgi:hypothetical protein